MFEVETTNKRQAFSTFDAALKNGQKHASKRPFRVNDKSRYYVGANGRTNTLNLVDTFAPTHKHSFD